MHLLYRFVQTAFGAAADKPAGVVALTCFDLRRLGKVSMTAAPEGQGQKEDAACRPLNSGYVQYKASSTQLPLQESFPGRHLVFTPASATRPAAINGQATGYNRIQLYVPYFMLP